MAHPSLTVAGVAITLLASSLHASAAPGTADAPSVGPQSSGITQTSATQNPSQDDIRAQNSASGASGNGNGIGKISPIVPPLPPAAIVKSVECAVPIGKYANNARLPALVSRLRNKGKPRILAIGSSSTWGVGARQRNGAYPARLENILEKVWKKRDIEIFNRGISGEVAAQTAPRLIEAAAELRPDLVLWQLGTNDAVTRVRIADFRHTVVTTIRLLRNAGIDVVLVGLQYTPRAARNEHYRRVRDTLREISREEKVLYVRRYAAMQFLARNNPDMDILAKDRFHLNDLGYQCMAEHIAQAVITSIYVRRKDKPAAAGSTGPAAPPAQPGNGTASGK